MTQACERADQHSAKSPHGEEQCYARSGRLGHDQMTFLDADNIAGRVNGTAVAISRALIAILENY